MISLSALLLGIVLFDATAPAGGSCTNTSILTWYRVEALAQGTGDYPDTGVTWSATGTDVINASAVKNGTNGMLVDADNEKLTLSGITSNARADNTKGTYAFWLMLDTAPSGTIRIMNLRDADQSSYFRLQVTSSSQLNVNWLVGAGDGGGGLEVNATSTSTLSTSTWYFVQVTYDSTVGAGSDVVKVAVDNSTTGWIDITNETMTALSEITIIEWGAGGTVIRLKGDHLLIASDPAKDLYSCKDTASYP